MFVFQLDYSWEISSRYIYFWTVNEKWSLWLRTRTRYAFSIKMTCSYRFQCATQDHVLFVPKQNIRRKKYFLRENWQPIFYYFPGELQEIQICISIKNEHLILIHFSYKRAYGWKGYSNGGLFNSHLTVLFWKDEVNLYFQELNMPNGKKAEIFGSSSPGRI